MSTHCWQISASADATERAGVCDRLQTSLSGMAGITLICIFAACTGTAPFYTLITWAGQQFGVSVSAMGLFEVYSWDAAIAHTGTYVRASLYFAGVAAIPAVIILRVIALQPVRRRKMATASPSAPPQAPAA